VNLTLVQCEFHAGKKLSLQESNQLNGIKMPTSVFSRSIWFLIPVSRRGKRGRPAPSPWQAKCKNWDPLADIMIFSTVLVSVGCNFLSFSGWFRFLARKKHLRHPGALLFLNLFSECWLVVLYGGQWAPSAKFCLPRPKPLAMPLGGKCPFCPPPATVHAIIDYFISCSTKKASSSNETKKRF